MKAYIENEHLLNKPEDEKKILSALNRIGKAFKEITDLDYTVYMSAHGNINVMNSEKEPFINHYDYHHKQIASNIAVEKTDCGDW